MAIAHTPTNKNIDQLNSFLRGEMSAVETYRIALERLDATSPFRSQLEQARDSHIRRVQLLDQRIRELGGAPAESSGAWGALTKVIQGGAAIFGEKAAVAALEEGEDHGLKDYRVDLDSLDVSTRQMVVSELLPQQEETHALISTLKEQLATA